jgi:hypothetical protein
MVTVVSQGLVVRLTDSEGWHFSLNETESRSEPFYRDVLCCIMKFCVISSPDGPSPQAESRDTCDEKNLRMSCTS